MLHSFGTSLIFKPMIKLNDALRWRYATQIFDTSKELSQEALEEILEAGNLAATAYGLQPFEFIMVKDQAVKDSLLAASFGQEHAVKNSVLVVIAIRTDIDEAYISEYIERISKIRNIPIESLDGFKQSMLSDMSSRTPENRNEYAAKNAFIALGTMMAAASELGVDNHAMLGFDPDQYDQLLNLKDNLHSSVILALCHRSPDDVWQGYAKVRKNYEDIVTII